MAPRAKARSGATVHKDGKRTWIVVADGGHARILESGEPHSGVTLRLDLTSEARKTAGKLAADRLPRTQESKGAARHGIEPRIGLKDREREIFAARLSSYLAGGIDNFDRLVLVAPMRFLHRIEACLSAAVAKKVSGMSAKDLTWMSDSEVLDHLGAVGAEIRRRRASA